MPAPDIEKLRAVKTFPSLVKYLRDELDWPIESEDMDEVTFEWTTDELRVQESNAERLSGGVVRQLQPLIAGQPWGIFFVEFASPQVYRTALRQILRGLVPSRRRDASLKAWQHQNLLFICATKDYDRFTFAHFKGDNVQKAKLSTFSWQSGSSYLRTLREFNLPALAWPDDDDLQADAWLAAWAKAFDKEPLTKEFFKRFDKALDAVKGDLQKHHGLNSAEAYSRGQLLLERLIFLYFLQRRGWLDQQRDYLLANFRPHQQKPDKFTYYEDFLDKLFWTLASPPGAQERFSGIPFLNGGLFDDDEFAPTPLRRKQNPPLLIRNATFAVVFDDFLEAFNFTVREDTPLDQDVAVDPEMLGKVFESIVLHAEAADPDAVAPDKRKATGSYYTPRIVVHFICRESLYQYLTNHLTGPNWPDRLKQILALNADDGLDPDELKKLRDLLTPAEGTQLLNLLASLKCCDPAVGSGAFPVGLMHELLSLRRIAAAAANGYVDPVRKDGNVWLHGTKADIVENSLYGVDIQQQAIEICRLRLWLSLIVDYDLGVDPFTADRGQFRDAIGKISQLPNLEMNFRRGDSLLDYISGVPVHVFFNRAGDYADDFEKIRKLGSALHKAKKSERKKKLRLDILGLRLSLSQRVLTDERKRLQQQKDNLTPGLLAEMGFDENASERETRERVERDVQQIGEALAKLDADQKDLGKLASRTMASDFYPKLRRLEGADFDSPFNFAWRIDFPTILGDASTSTLAGEMTLVNESQRQQELTPKPSAVTGGFDIVVGNPPFVTARNPVKRELYRERWPRVCHMKFLLVCPFFEVSFGLLKSGGQLGFIVSNAFAKREFGKPLVEDFFPTVDVQKVIDCSGLMFPGHGTPTCIVFGRHAEPDPKLAIRVAAILPGGGDLHTPPEESPLWRTLAEQHDHPGYESEQVIVQDRKRADAAKWPWNFDLGPEPTKALIEQGTEERLRTFLATDVGFMFIIGRNDIFMFPPDVLRRHLIGAASVRRIHPGEDIRNYSLCGIGFVIFPYRAGSLDLIKFPKRSPERDYFDFFERELSDRPTFSGTFAAEGREPYEFHQLPIERAKNPKSIAYPEIATHGHFVYDPDGCAFHQKSPLLKLPLGATCEDHHLIEAVLNSSAALFWLKQVCFNKGAGEDEHRDRFEYAGGKVQQLPVPSSVAVVLRGKSNGLSERLTVLSKACWERGRQMPSLSLKKLFEKDGEAYHGWNASLPGHVAPHRRISSAFASSASLREAFQTAVTERETLRAEMIALQEEMDWLVYAAYGLVPLGDPAVSSVCHSELVEESQSSGARKTTETLRQAQGDNLGILPLAREHRPFVLWAQASGDYAKAVALIPSDWLPERKALWQARLAAIRDNEHIRRIEQPVYKRRWDEQWKVGNRWCCGPVAYAAELVDAFNWFLAEKAEWHLEKKAGGGPLDLETWTAALWKDSRVSAAWPVVAACLHQLDLHKLESKKKVTGQPVLDATPAAFARYFKSVVKDESVPQGIPWAVSWDELEKKKIAVPASVKAIRGKLNVPRERFRVTAKDTYIWAGKS